MDKYFIANNKEVIQKITKIDSQIKEEEGKDNCNSEKVTKLMFEQLLAGLYLNNNIQNNFF